MKKLILLMAACALLTGAYGDGEGVPVEGYPWTTEVHPDWATVLDGKANFTVPADTAWIVDGETEMAKLNDWINGTAKWGNIKFGNANSALILDNTTTWFSNGPVFYNARGCLVKRGASLLANTGADLGYFASCDWYVEEGTLKEATHYFNNPASGGKVIVKSGATFWKAFSCPNGNTEIVLEGTGVDGNGALIVDKCNNNGMLSRVTLADDALIALNVDGTFFDRYVPETSPGHYSTGVNPAELKLNGHTLTIGGTAAKIGFRSADVTSAESSGSIVLASLVGGGERTLDLLAGANLSANVTVTAKGDAKVLFDGADGVQAAAIVAEGNLTFAAASAQGTTDAVWAGAVQIAVDKTVTVNPDGANRTVTIAGVISGEGGLQVGTSGAATSGNVRLLSANTYAGTALVNISGKVFLGSATSIPDLENLTLTAGTLCAAPRYGADGELTFDADGVLALLAKTPGATAVQIDTTEVTNAADLTISSADVASYFPNLGLTWDGYGTGAGYTLEGPYADDKPLNIDVKAGTVRLSGEDPIAVGTFRVSGTSAESSGTLVLDGAADVVSAGQTMYVGSDNTSLRTPVARMTVKDSTFRSTGSTSYTSLQDGAFIVGGYATGILTVEEGAVVSNKLVVGGASYDATGSGCIGVVRQNGGLVAPCCGGGDGANADLAPGGHGYYELNGGVFRPTGTFMFGLNGSAVFLQNGGLADFPKGAKMDPWYADGRTWYTILGGKTVTAKSSDSAWSAAPGLGGWASVTVQGETAELDASVSGYGGIIHCGNNNGDTRVQYNLNDGGTMTYGGFYCYKDSYSYTHPLIVSFNGGRVRNCGWTQLFLANSSKYPAKVVIGEKGAIFSATSAGTAYNNVGGVLTAEKKGGVRAIALPEGGLAGYPAAPYVEISGEGYGANAIALINGETFTVTNILITAHGWGYKPETTTVKLMYGSYTYGRTTKYTFPAEYVTIGENPVGGITVESGTFSLYGANVWEKWTKVVGGTLKAMEDGTIPSGTALTLSDGGKLDLNGHAATFAGLAGNGGTVVNGAVVMEDGATISAKKFVDRETTVVTGTLDLSGVTSLTLTDTEVLDEAAKKAKGVMLFTATDLVLPQGGIEVDGVPPDFHVTWRPNGLRLGPDRGAVLIVR